jgi:hypothetical protein
LLVLGSRTTREKGKSSSPPKNILAFLQRFLCRNIAMWSRFFPFLQLLVDYAIRLEDLFELPNSFDVSIH